MTQATEIERKFLVRAMPDLSRCTRATLRQGYVTIPTDSVELRLRQSDDTFVLCVKSGAGLVRSETETVIDDAQFRTLWPRTKGRRIDKTRWTGALGTGLVFELDLFTGDLAPLATVEVEFQSEKDAHAFVAPDWFGRDVTSDARFANRALALTGAALVAEFFR